MDYIQGLVSGNSSGRSEENHKTDPAHSQGQLQPQLPVFVPMNLCTWSRQSLELHRGLGPCCPLGKNFSLTTRQSCPKPAPPCCDMKCSNMLHLTSTATNFTRNVDMPSKRSSPYLVFSGPQTERTGTFSPREHLVLIRDSVLPRLASDI